MIDPIYVSCHLCHADVGQACRWGCAPGEYHSRRVSRAERGPFEIDTEHALAHGTLCTGHSSGTSGWADICTVCGQTISRLQGIPKMILKEQE